MVCVKRTLLCCRCGVIDMHVVELAWMKCGGAFMGISVLPIALRRLLLLKIEFTVSMRSTVFS
jgi:hypothetical protein